MESRAGYCIDAELELTKILQEEVIAMELNVIKKKLYKEKPKARFKFIRMGVAYYYVDLEETRVQFEVPVSDMGDADFGVSMDAKLLNRWIVL